MNPIFSFVLLLFISLLPLQAIAASDGNLCDGPAILLCIPAAGVGALVESLTPDSPARKLFKAVEDGNLTGLKSLLARYPEVLTTDQLLTDAVYQYVYVGNPHDLVDDALTAKRLLVIKYLLEERTKISQAKLNVILAAQFGQSSINEPRLLEVGKLLIEHGATFADVNLSDYAQARVITEKQLDFIATNGADLDRLGRDGNPPVLSYLIYNHPAFAEALLQHGANPNIPRGPREHSGLVYFARHCLRTPTPYSSKEVDDRLQRACELKTAEQIGLLIQYGVDVNGLADPNTSCVTPYLAAKAADNQPLLEKLTTLGADRYRCTSDSLWK